MKLLYHPAMLRHQVDDECPEKPERLEELVDSVPWIRHDVEQLEQGQPAQHLISAPYGEQFLTLFHSPAYIQHVRELCRDAGDEILRLGDNCFSRKSYKAACYAVGAAVHAARLARKGRKSFAAVRPPGHHAHAEKESGFCIFNNIAIAAEYLRQKGERVFILDIDLHLGDGTLSYADGREGICYFSIHHESLWPHLHPGSGGNAELVELADGTNDEAYRKVLHEQLVPALRSFNPSIVAVSAGFDTHAMDYTNFRNALGGGFILSPDSYKEVWSILDAQLVPYFAVLEGGYDTLSVLSGVLSFFEKDE